MRCDERKDVIYEFALGTLQGAEREELLAHLNVGCPACEGMLAEARSVVALLGTASAVAPPPAAKNRVLAVTDHSRVVIGRTSPSTPVKSSQNSLQLFPAIVGGALAAGIAVLVFMNIIAANRKSLDNLKYIVREKSDRIAQLQEQVRQVRDSQRLIVAPTVQAVTLRGTPAMPEAVGLLLWEPKNRQAQFFAADFRNLPPGRAYELWLINGAAKKVRVGVFSFAGAGGRVVFDALPADPGQIVAGAVTDEPAAGVDQPTGTIQLLGKVN